MQKFAVDRQNNTHVLSRSSVSGTRVLNVEELCAPADLLP